MPIPETQLDIWCKQGSVSQSQTTYATVRSALLEVSAPYAGKSFQIFLQGSYGNDTNIYADSDVDIVIATDSIYYADVTDLGVQDKSIYEANRSATDDSYEKFKADVLIQLKRKFGSYVILGKKAIFVKGNGVRRDVDVIAAVEYRKYTKYKSAYDQSHINGICFKAEDGTLIVNYPKQHSANCTTKHQNTSSWFKPTIRTFKNMRNRMIEKNYLYSGIAPSYFLEGMLYNVSREKFGTSLANTVASSIDWIIQTDQSKLVCANDLYFLLHPTSPVTWRAENLHTYLNAVVKFWRDW